MRKIGKAASEAAAIYCTESYFDYNVENFKRRRALSLCGPDEESKLFFDRILNVKKIREFIFITKAAAKKR